MRGISTSALISDRPKLSPTPSSEHRAGALLAEGRFLTIEVISSIKIAIGNEALSPVDARSGQHCLYR